MEKKKLYTICISIAVLFAAVLIFVFLYLSSAANTPKAADLEVPVLSDTEPETQQSTFLETEMLAWKKNNPPSPAKTPPAVPTTENSPEPPPDPIETPNFEKAPATEQLIFKKLISLASDPPPETETGSDFESEEDPETLFPSLVYNDGIEKFLVLSFDDGPGPYTERLLEILAENKAKATFFVVGYKIASYEQIIKRIVKEGHEVAGHSWNHPNFTTKNNETINWELQATSYAIYETTGVNPAFYRAPYGAYNENVKNISKELGLSLIQWNIDVSDWRLRNAIAVYTNVMTMAKNGGVICMHDVHSTTVEAMERAIPDLIASGYKLITVSEMFGDMEPGLVYYNRGFFK